MISIILNLFFGYASGKTLSKKGRIGANILLIMLAVTLAILVLLNIQGMSTTPFDF